MENIIYIVTVNLLIILIYSVYKLYFTLLKHNKSEWFTEKLIDKSKLLRYYRYGTLDKVILPLYSKYDNNNDYVDTHDIETSNVYDLHQRIKQSTQMPIKIPNNYI